MLAQPLTEAFKPTIKLPDALEPEVIGLVGGEGGLVGIDGDVGKGAAGGAGVGDVGAGGVDPEGFGADWRGGDGRFVTGAALRRPE